MSKPRFHNILTGACPAPLFDTVLWDLGDAVVTPTLGSIIPNWFLVIPRSQVLSIAKWLQKDRALCCVHDIARRVGRSANDVIWFEHGPAVVNGVTGCGVDHAHIHLLIDPPFTFEQFKEASKSASSLNWNEKTGNPYNFISPDESYLVAARGDDFVFASGVESAGSQFFRRVIATLVGRPNSWDYKSKPHLDNVELTIASARRAA